MSVVLIDYLTTVFNLKIIQVRFQLWYRIKNGIRRSLGITPVLLIPSQGHNLKFTRWIGKPVSFNNSCFTFLNKSRPVAKFSEIDWNELEYGRLWAYNLNYMDYLLQPGMKAETGLDLINNFINNLPGNKIGLEPYPISLRTSNWIKFISSLRHSSPEIANAHLDRINSSLYAQYCILIKNLEYHLLGNHLLENGFSLLFGAFYFRDEDIFKKSKRILMHELEEQVLEDGCHFELSPMYHQIILDRLLDAVNLLRNNNFFTEQSFLLTLLEEKSEKMLGWLNKITYSNGGIPLFNDSAYGIAAGTGEINEYAERLNLKFRPASLPVLSRSGFRKFEGKKYELVFDMGDVGPLYQPGHAHADTFNFELFINNCPVIMDTGTSTYEKGCRREMERSTISHNTVTIDNRNSSAVWASHRVGRRAKVNVLHESLTSFKGTHDGYGKYLVRREINTNESEIFIVDSIQSGNKSLNLKSGHPVSRLHFHPGCEVTLLKNVLLIPDIAEINFEGYNEIRMIDYYYAPEFNRVTKSKACEIHFSEKLLIRIIIY